MKKSWNILVLTLAANFLALAGAVAWMYSSGRLDRQKIQAVKELLFPPPDGAAAPATQPAADAPTTRPVNRLDEFLARQSGRSAAEQVQFIQSTAEAHSAQFDRRQRELGDLQRQLDLVKQQLERDRAALEQDRQQFESHRSEAMRLETDKGFEDSLQLYQTMPARQAKTIFMSLDDQTVRRYLQAMQPRVAARIVKEFKSTEEVERIQRVLEQMRLAEVSKKD